jgi:universal stress protein E
MNPLRNILVIVDPTAESHPAVTKAAHLAGKLGAHLELYVCDTRAARESRLTKKVGHPVSADGLVSLDAFLDGLAQPLRERGVDVSVTTEFGDPLCDRLIEKTKRTSADLVVKDTHHHSLPRRTFLSNTDWQLIRACPLPLLLTKAATWAAAPKIFAAVDPGHVNDKPALLDNRIMQYASCLARQLAGELHVLHAYIPVAVIAAAVGGEPSSALALSAEEIKAEEDTKRKEVLGMVAQFDVDPDRVHVQLGGPAQLLPHAARQLHADVMVMGALSRRGLKRAFIGSTAEDVLEHLPCDALIVKPPDFAEALQGLCP